MPVPASSDIARTAATLALSFLGGAVLHLAGVPAAWLTGGVFAVALAELRGFRSRVPDPVRELCYLMLGASLGSSVSPGMFARMGEWALSIGVLVVSVVLVQVATQAYLVHRCGWDRRTAFFSAVPGAFGHVLAVADETGADTRLVAVAQLVRVVALVLLLPGALALFGLDAVPPDAVPAISWPDALKLTGAVVLGAALFALLRMPAALLTGALVASMLAYGTGLVSGVLPPAVLVAAIVILAATVGSRFRTLDLRMLGRAGLASAGAFLVSVAVAFGIALLLANLVAGVPLASLIVAFAPGGLDAMLILALSLHLDTAFIATHQLLRFMAISLALPVAGVALRRLARDGAEAGPDV